MIIGNGLLANAFRERFLNNCEVFIFASGVSNSGENSGAAFEREKILLSQALKDSRGATLVYFSTCSIEDPDMQSTPYVRHKIAMEKLIEDADSYFIFRLPQVVGVTKNPYTLTNFLYKRISENESFKVWKQAKRNLIDVEDIVKIAVYFIEHYTSRKTINIANLYPVTILEIVRIFEAVLDKFAKYELIDAGSSYGIDIILDSDLLNQLNINFGEYYYERLIKKYYGK